MIGIVLLTSLSTVILFVWTGAMIPLGETKEMAMFVSRFSFPPSFRQGISDDDGSADGDSEGLGLRSSSSEALSAEDQEGE